MDQPSSADDSGITLRIKFKSESVDLFIARYGTDVSPGGIFIRTKDPLGVGTSLRFEFSLADGQPLLVGQGTVVWVREPDQARAGVVPGMGVRFDKLTGHSQNVLGTILAGKAKRDGSGAARLAAPGRVSQAAVTAVQSTDKAQTAPTPTASNDRPRPSAPVTTLARTLTPGDGSSDPWQSDKTEIARMPPNFVAESFTRSSEELSLSGAISEPELPPPPPPAPPAAAAPPPRKPIDPVHPPRPVTPALGMSPQPAQPETPRRSSASLSPLLPRDQIAAGLRTSPGIGPPPGGPLAPGNMRTSSPGMAIGEPDDGHTDRYNREQASVTAPMPTPGRGKMLAVIGVAAAITCATGFFVLQKQLAQRTTLPPPPPSPVAIGEPAPSAPPPAAAPALPPAPAPAAAAPATPPAEPPKPAAAPPTPPPVVAEAKPAPTIEPKPARPARPARTRRAAARTAVVPEPPAEGADVPPATDDPTAAASEEYWLRVSSNPSGAEVLIDGQVEGKTPFERRLLDTSHPYALTVRKPGYESHEQMLSASDDWVKRGRRRTLSVSARLARSKGLPPASELEPPIEKPPAEKPVPETAPPPVEPTPVQP